MIAENSKSNFDNADFKITSGQLCVENISPDDNDFDCNEVRSCNTTSDDKYLSCSGNKPTSTSVDEEENTAVKVNVENTPTQINIKNTTVEVSVGHTSAQINSTGTTSDNKTSNTRHPDEANTKSTTEKVNVGNPNTSEDKDLKNYSETAKVNLKNTDDNFDTSEKTKIFISFEPKFVPIKENEGDTVKIVDLSNKMSIVYEVNGASFVEEDVLSQHDNEELERYELYQMDAGDDDNGMFLFNYYYFLNKCWTI